MVISWFYDITPIYDVMFRQSSPHDVVLPCYMVCVEHQECGRLTGTTTSVGVIDFTGLQQISPRARPESTMVHPSSLNRDEIPGLGMQEQGTYFP